MGKKGKTPYASSRKNNFHSMRVRGEITTQELRAVQNMQGRGLEPVVQESTIAYRQKGQTVAETERGQSTAHVYPGNCGDEMAQKAFLGLVAAEYEVAGYEPQTTQE